MLRFVLRLEKLALLFWLSKKQHLMYNPTNMERSVYRIIDANFNRAREAIRVIEEFCRFTVNSAPLTHRAKQLRHDLSSTIAQLPADRLLAARDTRADVGTTLKIPRPFRRTSFEDSLTAAFKRLPEALRTLSETTHTLNAALAEQLEELRYTAYTLEKDVTTFTQTTQKFSRTKLYVVISTNLPANVITLTQSCIAGGADCIQLRAKEIADDTFFALATQFVKLCREGNALSIINDRLDIAIASAADGVHLGQNDIPVSIVRKLQHYPLIVGKSTHSIEQLEKACKEDLTYVALGPVYATPTKPSAEAVTLDYVRDAMKILEPTGIPSVAIGGINNSNIQEVIKAGATRIAVCRAVTDAISPKAACKQLKEQIEHCVPA